MGSAGSPPSQSVLLIYPASEALLVYFIWLSEIPVSAQCFYRAVGLVWLLSFSADVETWVREVVLVVWVWSNKERIYLLWPEEWKCFSPAVIGSFKTWWQIHDQNRPTSMNGSVFKKTYLNVYNAVIGFHVCLHVFHQGHDQETWLQPRSQEMCFTYTPSAHK